MLFESLVPLLKLNGLMTKETVMVFSALKLLKSHEVHIDMLTSSFTIDFAKRVADFICMTLSFI